jgi:two-component system, NarL family, invasion response regulator UvrY
MPPTKIAIVDDHPLLRQALRHNLQRQADYRIVIEADNGRALLSALENSELPDIVLLDLSMPVLDGFETTIVLQQKYPNIKILVLSVYSKEEAAERILFLGASGYVTKSADDEIISEAIESIYADEPFIYLGADKKYNGLKHKEKFKNHHIKLGPTELLFLRHCVSGKSYTEIANNMCLSVKTIDRHRENLFQKLEINSRPALILYAIKSGVAHENFL